MIWGGKQPKTCFWVSAVGGRAFLQRSQNSTVLLAKAYPASSIKIRFTWERLGILKEKGHEKRKVGDNG